MATYNTIYTGIFDAFDAPAQYSIEIAKKDYVGDSYELTLSAQPVTQQWQEEGAKFPIKGCNLTVRMISKRLNGIEFSFSLADFYSEEDDTFLVYLYDNTNGVKLFKGFIVQDDCKEIQVDYAHEIVISATDNLGLLKDRRFDEAAYITGSNTTISENITFISPHTIFIGNPSAAVTFGVGTQIDISTIGTFTVSNINLTPFVGWFITAVEDVIDIADAPYVITWRVPRTINGYLSLKEIFRISLESLGLDLGARVYAQLYPIGGSTGRWLDDTYVLGESFLQADEWLSCYEIMERILNRFRASLFQCNGFWTIVRWGELWRYTTVEGATIAGYVYNRTWDYLTTTDSIQNFHFGDGTDCETGVLKSINRPLNFVQDTFNYVQPESLLCNYNLQKLGQLYQEYEDVPNNLLVKQYYAECWTYNFVYPDPPHPLILIAIEYDNNIASDRYGQELSRYMVISGPSFAFLRLSAQSAPIQINAGDVVTFNYSWRSDQDYTEYTIMQWSMGLYDGTTLYGLDNNAVFGDTETSTNGVWGPFVSSQIGYIFLSGDHANEWHTVTITTAPAPIDGQLYIYLPQFPRFSPDYTTHIQDMSINIKSENDSTYRSIGQRHTDTQVPAKIIKNNETVEIFIDDCIRSAVSGALFLESYTNLNRNLTINWNYTGASLSYALGQLVTIEQLFQRWYPKDIYNGTTTYIKNNDGWIINPMSVFLDGQVPELKRYVTGSLSVDYKNSACDFTIYELDNSDRTMAEFNTSNLYEFNYLYEKS
jgi:hypothetical protein